VHLQKYITIGFQEEKKIYVHDKFPLVHSFQEKKKQNRGKTSTINEKISLDMTQLLGQDEIGITALDFRKQKREHYIARAQSAIRINTHTQHHRNQHTCAQNAACKEYFRGIDFVSPIIKKGGNGGTHSRGQLVCRCIG
jgi:hypothetical protein